MTRKDKEGRPRQPLTRRKKILITVTAIIAILAAILVALYLNLNKNVRSEDINQYLTQPRPTPVVSPGADPNANRAVNYVLIGSDTRNGSNLDYGGEANSGQRSDTTIIAHISKDRKRVDMLSIPRDSIVDIPSCKLSDGTETAEQPGTQFNAAFSEGDNTATAVACTVATIEKNTGIFIDGYAVVDFAGFADMVNSVGGVTYTVPERLVSSKANLDLQAGKQTLNGDQALAYARARTFEVGGGDGSDLSRITRQQDLLKAFAAKLTSADTMGNPATLYSVAGDVLKSMTVSPELGSVDKLAGFAYSMKNLPSSAVKFTTVPTEPWYLDENRVIFSTGAGNVFDDIINDKPVGTAEKATDVTGQ